MSVLESGVQLIPITTPKGEFRVWTRRVGNNPTAKLLLLHGGPGATHEYFVEACDAFLPSAGIEYYYDQLGSAWSDQPDDPDLWTMHCPDGSHMAMYDDQATYFAGSIEFIRKVERGAGGG